MLRASVEGTNWLMQSDAQHAPHSLFKSKAISIFYEARLMQQTFLEGKKTRKS